MTRQKVNEILKTPFYRRKALAWESCAKKFYQIKNVLAMEHLMGMSEETRPKDAGPMVLKCEVDSEVYFFGIGLEECESLSLEQLRKLYNHGTWYVYSWAE